MMRPKVLLLMVLCALSLSVGAQRSFVPSHGKCMVRELPGKEGFEVENNSGVGPRILARIPGGDMQRALQNPTFRWILDSYGRSIGRMPAPKVLKRAEGPDKVEPLLTDLWHQFAPYNALTPQIGGEHCATGCVAHALAQVIRYHRYAQGTGTYTYTDLDGCGQTLSTTLPAMGYDFDRMLDVYEEGAYTPEQLTALATLLRDCGILVQMQYGVDASGAYSVRQPIALANALGYDRGLQMYFRDFYTYSEWEQMLRHELQQGRPVLMSASSASLSHAFCCDGYDEQGLFHLNLGMAGDADGYYYLPYLTPKQPEWYDEDNPEGGMNLLQYMTVGIQPPHLTEGEASAERHSFGFSRIMAVRETAARHDSLSVATMQLANVGWNAHEGRVALALKHNEDVVALLADYPHGFLLEELDDTTYSDTLRFAVPLHVQEGRYRVVPVFEQSGGRWEEARTSVGVPNYLFLSVSEDSLRLQPDAGGTASLELADYDFPDSVVRGSRPPFTLALRCHGAEYCGRYYVILSPEDNPDDLRIIQLQGLTLADGETTVRDFRRTYVGLASGNYHLRVAYDVDLFTDSLVWLSPAPLKTIRVVEPASGVALPGAEKGGAQYVDLSGRRVADPRRRHGIVVQKTRDENRKVLMK